MGFKEWTEPEKRRWWWWWWWWWQGGGGGWSLEWCGKRIRERRRNIKRAFEVLSCRSCIPLFPLHFADNQFASNTQSYHYQGVRFFSFCFFIIEKVIQNQFAHLGWRLSSVVRLVITRCIKCTNLIISFHHCFYQGPLLVKTKFKFWHHTTKIQTFQSLSIASQPQDQNSPQTKPWSTIH